LAHAPDKLDEFRLHIARIALLNRIGTRQIVSLLLGHYDNSFLAQQDLGQSSISPQERLRYRVGFYGAEVKDPTDKTFARDKRCKSAINPLKVLGRYDAGEPPQHYAMLFIERQNKHCFVPVAHREISTTRTTIRPFCARGIDLALRW
jgi:hypothetical protein